MKKIGSYFRGSSQLCVLLFNTSCTISITSVLISGLGVLMLQMRTSFIPVFIPGAESITYWVATRISSASGVFFRAVFAVLSSTLFLMSGSLSEANWKSTGVFISVFAHFWALLFKILTIEGRAWLGLDVSDAQLFQRTVPKSYLSGAVLHSSMISYHHARSTELGLRFISHRTFCNLILAILLTIGLFPSSLMIRQLTYPEMEGSYCIFLAYGSQVLYYFPLEVTKVLGDS